MLSSTTSCMITRIDMDFVTLLRSAATSSLRKPPNSERGIRILKPKTLIRDGGDYTSWRETKSGSRWNPKIVPRRYLSLLLLAQGPASSRGWEKFGSRWGIPSSIIGCEKEREWKRRNRNSMTYIRPRRLLKHKRSLNLNFFPLLCSESAVLLLSILGGERRHRWLQGYISRGREKMARINSGTSAGPFSTRGGSSNTVGPSSRFRFAPLSPAEPTESVG